MRRPVTAALAATCLALGLGACGSQDNEVLSSNASSQVKSGSQLFVDKCAGCHTLDTVGAEGSSSEVRDKERVDGPNFNVRKECASEILYAIRNGGYSGAIMPENLVVGQQAEQIAAFLERYSGLQKKTTAGAKKKTCPGA
jgi:mono/diheme cytochrome c family protein